jgi:hypothetical protein
LNSQKVSTEIYLASNKPQGLVDEFSRSTKILDAEYKPAILEEVTLTCAGDLSQYFLPHILFLYQWSSKCLEEDYSSEWASPTFAIAKKNGTIRVVSDFRKINSLL